MHLTMPYFERAHILVVGDLMLYLQAREVVVGGAKVDLTRIEFDLLDTLTVTPCRPCV